MKNFPSKSNFVLSRIVINNLKKIELLIKRGKRIVHKLLCYLDTFVLVGCVDVGMIFGGKSVTWKFLGRIMALWHRFLYWELFYMVWQNSNNIKILNTSDKLGLLNQILSYIESYKEWIIPNDYCLENSWKNRKLQI